MEPPWDVGMKMCSNVPGHMTKMASRPIYCKNVQNLLRNQETDNLETWYTASGTQVLPNLFKWWHWVDHDHGKLCFLMPMRGWKLIQHIVLYFQACSNSAYPMHSGERYRTNGPLVISLPTEMKFEISEKHFTTEKWWNGLPVLKKKRKHRGHLIWDAP